MKKRIIITIGTLAVLSVVFFVYYLYCTALIFERVYVETERIKSPDGKAEAVLVDSDVGATSAYIFYVYIVEAGEEIAEEDKPVFSAYSIKGQKISWLKDRFLEIKYEKAKISNFSNYEYPLSEESDYLVEIRQTPTEDSALE